MITWAVVINIPLFLHINITKINVILWQDHGVNIFYDSGVFDLWHAAFLNKRYDSDPMHSTELSLIRDEKE